MPYSWLNPPLPAKGDKAWFGWPKDDEIEALRKAWLEELKASDSEVRQEIATEIQERAFETVPDRTRFARDRLPEKPARRHQGAGLVYVERREV